MTTSTRHRPPITAVSSLFGYASAAEDVVTQSILSRPHGHYTDHAVGAVIVPTYFNYATATGLDPVIVLAHVVYTTQNLSAWWADPARCNPARIGVDGRMQAEAPHGPFLGGEHWEYHLAHARWEQGARFENWHEEAIPIHIGLLLAHLLPAKQGSAIQRALIGQALALHPLPAARRGSVRTLAQLGAAHNPSGDGWVRPGTTYGRNIAAVAVRLACGR